METNPGPGLLIQVKKESDINPDRPITRETRNSQLQSNF
jgi:hypothetical protein